MDIMNTKALIIYCFFLFLMISLSSTGQKSKPDMPDEEYSHFLCDKGLSEYFQVYKIDKIRDKLILKLRFNYTSKDSASVVWDKLSHQVKENHNFTIEELLFFRWLKISKQTPNEIGIFIKDRYPKHSSVLAAISWDNTNNKVKVRSKIYRARSIVTVDIKLKRLNINQGSVFSLNNGELQREFVYSRVLEWAENKYNKENAVFIPESATNDEVLRFKVYKLKNEALNEDNFWLCQVLNWVFEDQSCDFRPYEYHKFEINFSQNIKKDAYLHITIDGRYAPVYGDYNNWDKCTDMHLQFNDEFNTYSNRIKVEISKLFE